MICQYMLHILNLRYICKFHEISTCMRKHDVDVFAGIQCTWPFDAYLISLYVDYLHFISPSHLESACMIRSMDAIICTASLYATVGHTDHNHEPKPSCRACRFHCHKARGVVEGSLAPYRYKWIYIGSYCACDANTHIDTSHAEINLAINTKNNKTWWS